MKSKYELLAPAGDFSTLVAAVNAGADAVYFGLKEFSMRANAKNFGISDLKKINEICNLKNVKKYLTLNTIIYDKEIKKIENVIKKVKGKIDAIICWDLAVVELCRKHKIPFFISTQASVSNIKSVETYKKLGAKRIILARELNLKQVKNIIKNTGIEIECFVHGAMCVAVSGRCFTSQFLFNKSANRGECLQPCRRSYAVLDNEGNELKLDNKRVMSAKDLCALPFIEEMKKAGIKAYKIEGRNRDARYVDAVVRIYRKALDKKLTKKELKESLEELDKVYHRGFSSGFYIKNPNYKDFSDVENSASKEKKHFVGKITHYYPKIKVATIKLSSNVKIGDEIIIIGKDTGIVKSKIDYMEINNKSVKEAAKGEEIGLKIKNAKKNNEVYKIIKNKK